MTDEKQVYSDPKNNQIHAKVTTRETTVSNQQRKEDKTLALQFSFIII